MKTKKINGFFAIALALALSGCGGGGSSAGGGNFLDDGFSNSDPGNVQTEFGRIADSIPAKGSVTQSTNTGTDDVTEDEMSITISGEANSPVYELVYNNGLSGGQNVTVNINANIPDVYYGTDDGAFTDVTLQVAILGGNNGVNFDPNGDGEIDGRVYMDMYTDYAGAGDTDYFAGGFWLFIPNDYHPDSNPHTMGAFVDGTSEFNDLSRASGSVTYNGRAAGAYSISTENRTEVRRSFADVELTANFSNDTIRGSFTNVQITRSAYLSGSITLGNADMSGSDGFFTGSLSGTLDGVEMSGNWGGQFYGDTSAATPSVVAGTAGGGGTDTDTNTDYNFVAAFGAFRE